MKKALIIGAVVLVIAFLLGSSFIGRRNQMAVKREAVNAAWAQVDVVLQRRFDLIPNLVETVKGFATQEQIVFGEIAKARGAYLNATTPTEKIAANNQLDASLAKVLVLTENYPQLKSNENFLRMQDELAGTENRIAVERRRYNEPVQHYNTFISLVPNSLVASLGGFARNDAYFKTDEGARQAPKVNFNFGKTPAPATAAPATPVPAKP
ncbi:MAG: LemA family protein [Candidatus Acidiferrum sp.]